MIGQNGQQDWNILFLNSFPKIVLLDLIGWVFDALEICLEMTLKPSECSRTLSHVLLANIRKKHQYYFSFVRVKKFSKVAWLVRTPSTMRCFKQVYWVFTLSIKYWPCCKHFLYFFFHFMVSSKELCDSDKIWFCKEGY